ncbi:MAG: CoA-binding protein [Flavobacteriaceae bacterium]
MDYKTLVLGASTNPERYAYKAVVLLTQTKIEVVAMGVTEGTIGSVPILKPFTAVEDIHTLSLYLAPDRQKAYYEYILALKPQRVLFNPGTENNELAQLLTQAEIPWENACTLVLLSTNQYQT